MSPSALPRLLGTLAACLACGCTTLKMASLHDARVLKEGDFAISLQGASAASVQRALLVAGHGQDSILALAHDSSDYSHSYDAGADPMVGINFARGMGGGWELNGGVDVSPLGPGCVMVDLGLKKRLYANPRLLLTGYGRLALGSTPNLLEWRHPITLQNHVFSLETQTVEADAQLMSLVRIFPRLSWYLNAGPTAGNISYVLEENSSDAKFQGDVPVYGVKTHMGLVFEAKWFEMAGEWGAHFLNYGYVPSLGLRAAFKTGWAE